ncbi:hypothetical protein KY334_03895 [Candidatus Woesearchaeota archaeon]|nr:hypothetical protein [Candidatus Woesearchaeota archaeon]
MEDKFENLASHINLLYEARNNMCKHHNQDKIKFNAYVDDCSLQSFFKFNPSKRDIYIWFNAIGDYTQEMQDFKYDVDNGKFLTPSQIGMPSSELYDRMHLSVSCEGGDVGDLLQFSTDGAKITVKDCVVNQTLHKVYQSKLDNIDTVYEAIDLAFDILLS